MIMGIGISIPVHAGSPETVLRVDLAPMYIANESIVIGFEGIYAINNIPQSGDLVYHVIIISANNTTVESNTISEPNGYSFQLTMNGIPEGYYLLKASYNFGNVSSGNQSGSFLVSPPPVPYSAFFLGNGELVFHSLMLNSTGKPNASYPFIVTVSYQYPGGSAVVAHVFNTTNMTFAVPDQGQTVVVNVMDKYGWLNSQSINIQEQVYTGMPLVYTFGQVPQPYASTWLPNILIDVVLIAVLLGGMYKYFKRKSRGMSEDIYE